jgi:hypothetical protein
MTWQTLDLMDQLRARASGRGRSQCEGAEPDPPGGYHERCRAWGTAVDYYVDEDAY